MAEEPNEWTRAANERMAIVRCAAQAAEVFLLPALYAVSSRERDHREV
jgi:hypothetical protein